MLVSPRMPSALAFVLACALASPLLSASASAAPITVTVRVESTSRTLFEGPVSADAILSPPGISTKSSGGAHPCDVKDNGSNGGFGAAAATPTVALYDAAVTQGVAFDATWSSSFNDFLVSQVGTDVNGGAPEFPSWGYAVNYTTAGVGGCQFQLAPGSEVLWAYNYFNLSHLLSLSGPASVNAGAPFTLHVTDGQTGQPISGAAIGQAAAGTTTTIPFSPITDASGNATISLAHAGTVTLKATRSDSVRSNGLAICVHGGNDGSCGTTVSSGGGSNATFTMTQTSMTGEHQTTVPEVARVADIKNGHIYSRRFAPRVLRGFVEIPAGGTLSQVRIRLERRYRGHCFNFSGSRERFVRARKCGTATFFSVGGTESFSYLLPAPLRTGRYVYDIQAVDRAGHATELLNGVSHVIFRVK